MRVHSLTSARSTAMFTLRHVAHSLCLGLALTLPAWAAPQGSNSCATPQAIFNTGSFAYDTTSATNSAFNGGSAFCTPTQSASFIDRDVFFVWSSPCAGTFTVHNCGDGYDSVIAVHVGSNCSATCIDGNDGASVNCVTATESEVTFLAANATEYLIQIGTWETVGPGATGNINILLNSGSHPNDTCATPAAIAGLGSFAFDATGACTEGFQGASNGCNTESHDNDVFFVWTAASPGDYTISSFASSFQAEVTTYSGTNCSANCLQESGGTVDIRNAFGGSQYLIQVSGWTSGVASTGQLDVSLTAPPGNDDCSTPQAIAGFGSFTFDNIGSTDSGFQGGDAIVCGDTQDGLAPSRDLFFVWAAPCDDTVTVHNCSAGFDSTINVHLGSDCNATCIEGNDGALVNCTGVTPSEVIWSVTTGTEYLIQVGSFATSGPAVSNNFELVSALAGVCPPPSNDGCATPEIISGTGTFTHNSWGATNSGFQGGDPVVCGDTQVGASPGRDTFFLWTAPCDGVATIENCGEGFDSTINVHLGSNCSATCIDGSDSGSVNCTGTEASEVILSVTAGTAYLIQVGAWSTTGPEVISDFRIGLVGALANDTCATPTSIAGLGSFPFDTTGACDSGFQGASGGCTNSSYRRDVFFTWSDTVGGNLRFEMTGSTFDEELAVYIGSNCSATCVAEGANGRIDLTSVTPFTNYLIQVAGWGSSDFGAGTLEVTLSPPPPAKNDCSTPQNIAGLGAFPFDTTNATTSGFDGGNAATCNDTSGGAITNDVFFAWTAPCDGDYTVHNCGSGFDSTIAVHLGSNCLATCIDGQDGANINCSTNAESEVHWTASIGQAYLIQVGGWGPGDIKGAGNIEILLNTAPCPPDGYTITCDPNSNHYAGDYVKLNTSSFGSGIGSNFHLEATDGPPDEFGFFIISATATNALPVFNGILCLDNPTGRYNSLVAVNQGLPQLNSIGQFDAFGVMQSISGNATSSGGSGFDVPSQLPYSPGGQLILPGDTWSFQFWYRDQIAPLPNPGSSANWSNVANVQF